MTTSLSTPSPEVSLPTDTLSSQSKLASTGWQKEKRLIAAPLLAVGALVLLGAVGWAAIMRIRPTGGTADVLTAAVEPRTFNVVLKEKGELKAAKSTDIKCEVEGRSTIISLIPEGTAVKEGDLLVVLASDVIENRIREEELKESNAITAFEAAKAELDIQRDKNASEIRKAKLQIDLKGLELDKYQKGEWKQRLKDAQVSIDQAEISLGRREQDYNASKELFAKKYTTQTEFQETEFNFRKAGWELDKAKLALDVLNNYTHVADLKQRESDLTEATKEAERVRKNADAEETKKRRDFEGKEKELALIQDQLAKFRTQKEKCRITAPTQGFVVYYNGFGGHRGWSEEQQIKEGAEVFERQVLMQLPDTSSMMVVVRIHEAKTDKLRVDQPVSVTIEGIPGTVFSGRVQKIATVADSQNSWLNPDLKEYETEILLDTTDVPLKPGVTAHAEILVQNIEDRLAVPVQAIYAKSGKRYLFRRAGAQAEPVAVEVGAIGSEWAEIVSGVNRGERVLLAFGDEYRRMVPDAPAGERPDPGGMRRGGGPQGRRGSSAQQASAEPGRSPADPRATAADTGTPAAPEAKQDAESDASPAEASEKESDKADQKADAPDEKTEREGDARSTVKPEDAEHSSLGKAP